MISIESLRNDPLPGNYFAPDAYLQGDYELGLLENRSGDRLIAVPEILLEAIHECLAEEVGSASNLVMFQCGRWWGKNFYRRFGEDVSQYHDKPLAEMAMVELIQCIKQCWKTHGWGVIDLDMSYYQSGFMVATICNSPFSSPAESETPGMDYTETGILSAFFSQLTGRELDCAQISCASSRMIPNYFVLGLAERLQSTEAWVAEGLDQATIMQRLCTA